MTSASQQADSGPASTSTEESFKEFVVKRDGAPPLSFAGIVLAEATSRARTLIAMDTGPTLRATMYRTRGGKFITSLVKAPGESFSNLARGRKLFDVEDAQEVGNLGRGQLPTDRYSKAAVHDTFEDAVAWFRPGRLTDEIRKQLGLDKPERIE